MVIRLVVAANKNRGALVQTPRLLLWLSGKGQSSVPGDGLGVGDVGGGSAAVEVCMWAANEAFGEAPADFFWREACGPFGECFLLLRGTARREAENQEISGVA
jgi:hypothetical protein